MTSGMSPTEAQIEAERRLQEVQKTEESIVARTVKEEEAEAGLGAQPVGQ